MEATMTQPTPITAVTAAATGQPKRPVVGAPGEPQRPRHNVPWMLWFPLTFLTGVSIVLAAHWSVFFFLLAAIVAVSALGLLGILAATDPRNGKQVSRTQVPDGPGYYPAILFKPKTAMAYMASLALRPHVNGCKSTPCFCNTAEHNRKVQVMLEDIWSQLDYGEDLPVLPMPGTTDGSWL